MDIRNFFSSSKKPSKSSASSSESKKKKIILDSDEEDPLPPSKKKRILASDSDDDDEIFKKKTPAKKEEKVKKRPKPIPVPEPKLKPTTAADFFGSTKPISDNSTNKRRHNSFSDDDDFAETVKELDERTTKDNTPTSEDKINSSAKKNKLDGKVDSPARKSKSSNDRIDSPARKSKSSNDKIDSPARKSKSLKDDKVNSPSTKKSKTPENIKLQNENSPPNKGLASKLASKIKKENENNIGLSNNSSTINNYKIPKIKKEKDESPKEKDLSLSKQTEKSDKIKEDKSSSNKRENSFEEKNKSEKKKSSSKKKNESSYEMEIEKNSPKKDINKSINQSLNQSLNDTADSIIDPLEKRRQSINAYKKYLSRSGPSNPGSKIVPEGAPGCLKGLTFVLTGVLESLDREEVTEIIKKYDGRVTTSLSKNTTYLLVGDDPGESKMSKAEKLGTKTLDEDGLLEMIGKTSVKLEENVSPKKVKSENQIKKEPSISSKSSSSSSSKNSSNSILSSKNSMSSSTLSTPSPKPFSQTTNSPSSPKTQPLSSQEINTKSSETLMWVDKYKPVGIKNIIGQQGPKSNANKLLSWLKNWKSNHDGSKKLVKPSPWAKDDSGAFFKAALLSGPPGVGKTTTAHIICKEAGFDFVEMNASDTRSKKSLEGEISQLLHNTSIAEFASGNKGQVGTDNHALVMDEVDGMAGNEDRGGVQELIGLIKKSKVPIICMCNDRNHPKIRSLSNYCFDLRFYKPRIEQIRGAMLSVCYKEGIKIKPDALDQIIIGSNQDVRQVLHHLSVWSAKDKNLQLEGTTADANKSKKNFKIGPWDVCKKVFSEAEHKNMSIHDKSDLFFNDYSIAPLFVQENYPKAVPHSAGGKRHKVLMQLAKTAKSLADGDLVEKTLRNQQAWALLPTQAMFSSVIPGEYMSGHLSGQIEFPSWLGNNSRKNKFDRMSQELQMHMRLKISGSKTDVSFDYSSVLKNKILNPLVKSGSEGVEESVSIMNNYDLLREDLDNLNELTTWTGQKDPMSFIESKVKAAFTRKFNKESHLSPYATVNVGKMKKTKVDPEALLDEENEENSEQEETDDIEKDAMIKVKKKDTKKKPDSKGKNTTSKPKPTTSKGKKR